MTRYLCVALLVPVAALLVSGCSDVDYKQAEFYKDQGDFYYQNGKWDNARAEYIAAIHTNEDYFEAYIALAYTCRMRGKVEWIKSPNEYGRRMAEKNYREAHWKLEELLERDEGNPEAYHLRGLLWFDAGKFETAIENFDLALDHDPHHKFANFYKSLCLFMQGVEIRGQGAEAAEKGDVATQSRLNRDVAKKYEAAAKAIDAFIKNWDDASPDPAPQEADLKNWAKSLREMAKADGAETDEAKILMRKITNTAPALSDKGASDKSRDGQPVVRESDLPPNLRDGTLR